MRIVINGSSISELMVEKVREFRKVEIIECDFSYEDMTIVERALEHIKKNKGLYMKLVIFTAMLLNYNMTFVYAGSFGSSLNQVGNTIVGMLLDVAKWGCIGMGLRNMIITLINGGNIKQAMTEGIQYWMGYLFIQFYPQLFDLFSGIKF
jgi:hypothetical protein